MVSSSNPTVLTQYPLLHECGAVTRLFPGSCRWIHTALFPLINPIANATQCFRGMLTHMRMWSGITCPSGISIRPRRHISRITSPTCFRSSPCRPPLRCFSIITTWYLQSHCMWDKYCHSCIGSSSLSFHGTSPGGKAYFIPPTRGEGLVATNILSYLKLQRKIRCTFFLYSSLIRSISGFTPFLGCEA